MHYDFKLKFNKIDSQQQKNLLIPEIDWILNEAVRLFVKLIAKPRVTNPLGFETSQRTIDDIRTIVKNNVPIIVSNNEITLPSDYWHYVKGEVEISKNNCKEVIASLTPIQHDDEAEKSDFDNSNFEWRNVNGLFYENKIKLHTDKTFVNDKVFLSYIRKVLYIHNAKDFRGGTYNLPDGTTQTNKQDCELPWQTHDEIVDIAVMLASNQIESPAAQLQLNKLKLNNLIL